MKKIQTILKQLVKQRSYVPYEHEPLDYLTGFLRQHGFSVQRQLVAKGRFNLLAKKGSMGKSALIYMHLDTVLPAAGWSHNPLQLRKRNGRYTGLGCFDMKGGIAAFLSVLDNIRLKNHTLKLAFCIDEEGISEGVHRLLASSFIKDVIVSFCPEASIVPSGWSMPVMLTIGGRGRCVFEITVPGKLTHGAEDSDGVNAINQASILINNFKYWRMKSHKELGDGSFFIRSFHAENTGLSLPDIATFEIDCQLVPGQTPEILLQELRIFIRRLYAKNILSRSLQKKIHIQLKPRKTPYLAPYEISKTNKYVRLTTDILKKHSDYVSYDYAKSVGDQNVIASAGIPIVTVGPIGGNAHQAGEWVSIESLAHTADFYKELLASL